jgi:hypothetical protein
MEKMLEENALFAIDDILGAIPLITVKNTMFLYV